jgi:hypothetical protein
VAKLKAICTVDPGRSELLAIVKTILPSACVRVCLCLSLSLSLCVCVVVAVCGDPSKLG